MRITDTEELRSSINLGSSATVLAKSESGDLRVDAKVYAGDTTYSLACWRGKVDMDESEVDAAIAALIEVKRIVQLIRAAHTVGLERVVFANDTH